MKIKNCFSHGHLFEAVIENKYGELLTRKFISTQDNEDTAQKEISTQISSLNDFILREIRRVDEIWLIEE